MTNSNKTQNISFSGNVLIGATSRFRQQIANDIAECPAEARNYLIKHLRELKEITAQVSPKNDELVISMDKLGENYIYTRVSNSYGETIACNSTDFGTDYTQDFKADYKKIIGETFSSLQKQVCKAFGVKESPKVELPPIKPKTHKPGTVELDFNIVQQIKDCPVTVQRHLWQGINWLKNVLENLVSDKDAIVLRIFHNPQYKNISVCAHNKDINNLRTVGDATLEKYDEATINDIVKMFNNIKNEVAQNYNLRFIDNSTRTSREIKDMLE